MIQDIAPHVYHNHYDPEKTPAADSPVAFVKNRSLFCQTAMGALRFPTWGELENRAGVFRFLFTIDQTDYFLALEEDGSPKAAPAWEDWDYVPVFTLMRLKPKELSFAALFACQLGEWYGLNRFCGRCGTTMVHSEKERAMQCPHCRNTVYPRINPVVIVGVRSGDKLLLTKYKGRPNVPFYALVAGFGEIGETIEETVAREVYEETGVRVKNLRFYKSQPWALSDSLLFGFFCDLDGEETIKVDGNELSVAEWVPRGEIPNRDDGYALTAEMIEYFRVKGYGDYA
jgi:NAD+ diphosphatase